MRTDLRWMVGPVIPSRDRDRKPIDPARIEEWSHRFMELLKGLYGGATTITAEGINSVIDPKTGLPVILYEPGSRIVVSYCPDEAAYLEHRGTLEALLEEMGIDLNQQDVFCMASPASAFILPVPPERGEPDVG